MKVISKDTILHAVYHTNSVRKVMNKVTHLQNSTVFYINYFTSTDFRIFYHLTKECYYSDFIYTPNFTSYVVFDISEHVYTKECSGTRHSCALLCFGSYAYFRMESEQLIVKANEHILAQRALSNPHHPDLLVPDVSDTYGPGSDKVNLHSIYRDVAGQKPIDKAVVRDEINMHEFLEKCSQRRAHFPSVKPRNEQCVKGVPILDMASAQSMYEEGWLLPEGVVWSEWCCKRGLDYQMLDDIEIREIVIGQTLPDEIKEVGRWAYSQYRHNESDLPHGMLPFLVKEMRISSHDVLRFTSPNHKTVDIKLQTKLSEDSDGADLPDKTSLRNFWLNIPALIVFGDGISWAVSVSFDVREEGGTVILRKSPIPEELVEIFENLPTVVGFEVKDDIMLVEAMYRKMGAREFRLPGFIEMESLLVLGGVAMQPLSIVNVAHVFLGVCLNRISNKGDGKWFMPLIWLPRSLRVLILGDIKVIYLVSRLINISMREEVIPEVEIVCRLMGADQTRVLQWWSRFLLRAVSWVFVLDSAVEGARSRDDLLNALRGMDEEGNLLPSPPFRILLVKAMLKGGMSITVGGARYLHVERERFLVTYQIIASNPVVGFEDLTRTELSEPLLMYARFNQADVWTLPPMRGLDNPQEKRKLVFHPDLRSAEVHLAVETLDLDVLMKTFSVARRSLKDGLLEWARLNPSQIDTFMKAYIRDGRLRKKLNPIYEQVRMIYFRLKMEQPITIDCCEEYVAKKQADIMRRAERDVEDLQDRIDVLCRHRDDALDRVDLLLKENKKGKEVNRVEPPSAAVRKAGVHQEVVGPMESQRGSDGVWRRGVSPGRREACQTGVPVPVLPPRDSICGGGRTPWFDVMESVACGRPVMNSGKRSRSPSPDTVIEVNDDEVRVVRYIDSD